MPAVASSCLGRPDAQCQGALGIHGRLGSGASLCWEGSHRSQRKLKSGRALPARDMGKVPAEILFSSKETVPSMALDSTTSLLLNHNKTHFFFFLCEILLENTEQKSTNVTKGKNKHSSQRKSQRKMRERHEHAKNPSSIYKTRNKYLGTAHTVNRTTQSPRLRGSLSCLPIPAFPKVQLVHSVFSPVIPGHGVKDSVRHA